MHVLIVDDHPVVHETLSAVARSAIPGAEVCVEANLTDGLASAGRLGDALVLVLLDLGLPGCSGMEALTRFRRFPKAQVVVVSATEDAQTVRSAFDGGAAGFIPKTTTPSLMVAGLKLVASGGRYVPPQIIDAPRFLGGRGPASVADLGLTGRQAEVARLLMTGMAYRGIARQLTISENTVKQHAHAVYKALGVASRTEALVALARMGLKLD